MIPKTMRPNIISSQTSLVAFSSCLRPLEAFQVLLGRLSYQLACYLVLCCSLLGRQLIIVMWNLMVSALTDSSRRHLASLSNKFSRSCARVVMQVLMHAWKIRATYHPRAGQCLKIWDHPIPRMYLSCRYYLLVLS